VGDFEQQLQAAYNGVLAVLQPGTTYVLAGVSYTGQAIGQMLAAWIAVIAAYTDAKRNEQTELAQRRQIEPAALAFLKVLHDFVVGQFGATSQELTKFGFEPRKKAAPLTGKQLVIRTAKSDATRQKRGTLGSRQKASIHGEAPTSVVINPESTPSSPPPTGGATKTP